MPSIHIKEKTWDRVKDEMVKAVTETKEPIKPADVLDYALNKGLTNLTESDYRKMKKSR